MLCVTVWYGGTKLANSLVWLVVANHGRLSSGSTSDGLITIAISGFGGKVLIAEGACLDVMPFGMPYGGFFSGSCGVEELHACGLPGTLYGSEDMLNVLKKSLNRLLAYTSNDLSYVCYDH
jgi:hypothetical protein